MDDKVTVPRADIEAAIEDVCLGCYETAVKHLGAMLAAAPAESTPSEHGSSAIAQERDVGKMSPGMSGIVSVNDVIDIIDCAIVRLEELGSPPGDVLRLELEDAGKFLSLTKATPAEPAAWQYRLIGPSGTTKWRECNDDVRKMIIDTGHYNGVDKVPAELRPLYAAPSLHREAISEEPSSSDAVKTSPEVGEMVKKLKQMAKLKRDLSDGDVSWLMQADMMSEAASLLIALDAERGRLRTWNDRAAHAMSDALLVLTQCGDEPGSPDVDRLHDELRDLTAEYVFRSALPASDEGTTNE